MDADGNPPQGVGLTLEGQSGASVAVPADSTFTQRLYLTAEKGSPLAEGGQVELTLWVADAAGDRAHIGTVFHGRSE